MRSTRVAHQLLAVAAAVAAVAASTSFVTFAAAGPAVVTFTAAGPAAVATATTARARERWSRLLGSVRGDPRPVHDRLLRHKGRLLPPQLPRLTLGVRSRLRQHSLLHFGARIKTTSSFATGAAATSAAAARAVAALTLAEDPAETSAAAASLASTSAEAAATATAEPAAGLTVAASHHRIADGIACWRECAGGCLTLPTRTMLSTVRAIYFCHANSGVRSQIQQAG